jgi:hypothetical protein
VPLERFLVGNFSGAGHLKPLFRTGIGLNLGHFVRFMNDTLLAPRSGGNLWSLVGNICLSDHTEGERSPLKMERKGIRFQSIYEEFGLENAWKEEDGG